MVPYCEYFSTSAVYNDYYAKYNNDDNNYSGLVNDGVYDILVKIGRDMIDPPVKEIEEGLCGEMIVIKDVNTNKTYKYASFNDAFNIWNLSEDDETLLQEIDSRHATYKNWYNPSIYIIGPTPDSMYRAYEELSEQLNCNPVLANTRISSFDNLEDIYKARSLEVSKMMECKYVMMVLPHKATRLSVEMKMMEKIAKDNQIPIIYTNDPTLIEKAIDNVSSETSSNVKIVDSDFINEG